MEQRQADRALRRPAVAGVPSGFGPGPGGDGADTVASTALNGLSNAMQVAVPGAYYGNLARQYWQAGFYGHAIAAESAALVDAAIGIATLGQATRIEAGIRAAAKSVSESLTSIHPTFGPGPFATRSVPATSAGATAGQRTGVHEIGSVSGCHTCGTMNPGTKKGTWIPDHQPPTALNKTQAAQSLYPHCQNCSREQGLAIIGVLRGGGGW